MEMIKVLGDLLFNTHRVIKKPAEDDALKVDVIVLDINKNDFKPICNSARALAMTLHVDIWSADLVNTKYDEETGINNTAQIRFVVKGYASLVEQFVYLMNK